MKPGWTTVALGETLESSRAGYWGGKPGSDEVDVLAVRNGDIKAGEVVWKMLPTRSMTGAQVHKAALRSGDVLLTTSGDVGKVAFVANEPKKTVCATNFVRVLRANQATLHPAFLRHFMTSSAVKSAIAQNARGTTMQNLSMTTFLEQVQVPLPPLDEQRRIAETLDSAIASRSRSVQRQRFLKGFEEHLFHSMFAGAPAVTTVENIAASKRDSIRTGPFGSQLLHSEFTAAGVPVLGLDNVVGNRLDSSSSRFISRAKYEDLKRYTVYDGDVLVSIMGTVGRCAIVPPGLPTSINTKHICAITPDADRILPEVLRGAFLWHPESRAHLRKMTKGSIMSGLNMGIIKSMPIPTPDMKLQRVFVDRVRSSEFVQSKADRSINQTGALFASLQARAFRGEL